MEILPAAGEIERIAHMGAGEAVLDLIESRVGGSIAIELKKRL
jgi:hypothetical protein